VALAAATGNPWLALAAFGISDFFSSVLNCIGPTGVALETDHVFGDPTALPRSMTVIALPAILLGELFAHVARAPFRRTHAAFGEPIGGKVIPVSRR
jgi:hypothetical protein